MALYWFFIIIYYLDEVWFLVRSSYFKHSYTPWTWKNSIFLLFPFIFFAAVACIEMNFDVLIYHNYVLVKFDIDYKRVIFYRVLPPGIKIILVICIFRLLSSSMFPRKGDISFSQTSLVAKALRDVSKSSSNGVTMHWFWYWAFK